jgi:group I intron endonuclease
MDENKKGTVYKITSPSGRIYIGSTKNYKLRVNKYKKLYCPKQYKLYKSFLKYGTENHIFEVIWQGSIEEMYKQEAILGRLHNVLDKDLGLNLRLPKESDIYSCMSEETRQKLKNSLTGRKLSEETKAKMSLVNKNKKLSAETKLKMSISAKGKVRTKEHQEKLNIAMKGRVISLEQKKAISDKNKGNKQSKETIQKRIDPLKKFVIQMDLDDNFIKEWKGIISVKRELNISINQCLSGKSKTAGNFKWIYKK